jgi:prepilin peptidase CpaA
MDSFLVIFLGIVLAIAAVTDVCFRKIPNLLTFPAMATALCYHVAKGGLEGFLFSASGLVLGIAVLIVPFLLGGMGAGDTKLMGVVGATLGPKGVFIAALFTFLFGGIYAFIICIIHSDVRKNILKRCWTAIKFFIYNRQVVIIPADIKEKHPELCYGIAIVTATMFYVWWSHQAMIF